MKVRKANAVRRQPVQSWRLHRPAITADVLGSEIVGKQDDDIRTLAGGQTRRRDQRHNQTDAGHHSQRTWEAETVKNPAVKKCLPETRQEFLRLCWPKVLVTFATASVDTASQIVHEAFFAGVGHRTICFVVRVIRRSACSVPDHT